MRAPVAMRGRVGLVAAALFAALALAGNAARAADPYREASLALAEGLVGLFPPAEGSVVSVHAGEAYVDLSEKDLIRPGMELEVFRPGGSILHPVSKEVLGRYEESLGILTVESVRDRYSIGRVVGEATVAPGDRVRVAARRLRALLHVAAGAPGVEAGPLARAVVGRGVESGRFAIIDEPAWVPALRELGVTLERALADPQALRRLGERVPADLLLLVRVDPGERRPALSLEARSLRSGAVVGRLEERWPVEAPPAGAPQPAKGARAAGADPGEGQAELPAGRYVLRELDGRAAALAAGNVLGEGRVEIVVSDGIDLAVYRWGPERLEWKWDEKGRRRRVLSLDAADLDGDGRAEVLVAVVERGRVGTEIRSWRNGGLERLAVAPGVYLRAPAGPGGAPLLLGQAAGAGEVLAGRVERYRWQDGAPERVEGTALPRRAGIFGLAPSPLAGQAGGAYAMDPDGYIDGYGPDGERRWRSERRYGGYPPPASADDLFGPAFADEETFEERAKAFQGRLLAEAAGQDRVRLLVPRNFSDSPITMVRQRAAGRGEVVVLEGPADRPTEAGRTRAFEGYVADLARADVDGDGRAEILLVVNRRAGFLRGERGRLVAWFPGGEKNP